jgi:hypothetical protein
MTMIQKCLTCPNKDNGSYEIDTCLSSRPEFPHVDSPFFLLGRWLSSPCISILRRPVSILKTVHVNHTATRFVQNVHPFSSYNRDYLQTRTEMRTVTVLNKENKKALLTADGFHKMPHTQ